MNLERLQRWSDEAKNIFQVLAIIIAGVWTYLLFIRTEVPTLEYRAKTFSELSWSGTARPGECIANFYVTHENIRRSSYKVSSYRLRAWTFQMSRGEGELLRYVDLQDIQNDQPLFDQRYTSGPFVTQYPPNTSFRHSFEWVVKEASNTHIFFRIDLYLEGEDDDPRWHSGSWSEVCKPRSSVGNNPRDPNAAEAAKREAGLRR